MKLTYRLCFTIEATPEQVWDVLWNCPNWHNGFYSYDDLPAYVGNRSWIEYGERYGSKSHWQRSPAGRPYQLTEWTSDTSPPWLIYNFSVDRLDSGTRLTVTKEIEIHNRVIRVLENMGPRC